eukprot:gnl/TRDRNA2_/TRDRNA2_142277_c0_seq1.p1 gnl/TRDRNA2_/TRDRNA2_142277_c0~~gnl/TRDRNA2_/TRDRNA2_142277_c0_seq1.p1  ORF type:complete len:284 (+),score=35.96 gnl/TRDRNA2_/TRDRNA2_142277_c0_seq1:44-895(+)
MLPLSAFAIAIHVLIIRTHGNPITVEDKPAENKFDVVVIRSRTARLHFRRNVSEFECPADETTKTWEGDSWEQFKETIAGEDAMCERGCYGTLPVLAVNNGKPCAAALYYDAEIQTAVAPSHERFTLSNLIGNAGEECKGAATAILCYLIRNSKNLKGEFKPLRLYVLEDSDPTLVRYYESLGCVPAEPDAVRWNCEVQNPERCEAFADKVFDGDTYFADTLQFRFDLEPLPSLAGVPHFSTIPAVLIGLFASTGCAFALLHFNRRSSLQGGKMVCTEPFLAG